MHRTALLTCLTVPALLLTGCATTEVEPVETPEPEVAAAPAPAETPTAAPTPEAAAPTQPADQAPEVAGMMSQPPAEIASVYPQYLAAWQGTDPAAIAAFFAQEAVVTVPDGTTFTGKADIQSRWIAPGLPTMSEFNVVPESFEMSGDRITETGTFSFRQTSEGESEMVSGSYQEVWQRQPDGAWLIVENHVMDHGMQEGDSMNDG